MSTILRSAVVAVALLASASATIAAPRHHVTHQGGTSSFDNDRAFWDAQQRNGD